MMKDHIKEEEGRGLLKVISSYWYCSDHKNNAKEEKGCLYHPDGGYQEKRQFETAFDILMRNAKQPGALQGNRWVPLLVRL
jgi:hypothetical protein